jgi:hypothetical protein
MAKAKYTVLSADGAEFSGQAEGEQVELDLTREQKRAVIAAGWVEPVDSDEAPADAPADKKGGK